ncbi:MAG: hypothetical protein WC807_16395 [Hyphomicrobium sp.]
MTGNSRQLPPSGAPGVVRFRIADEASLKRLETAVLELAAGKTGEGRYDDMNWRRLFSDEDLRAFWWPSDAELAAWQRFWLSAPVSQRIGPDMPLPPWDFGSMIDAILGGEYRLTDVRRVSDDEAELTFAPFAYPYGGIAALRALVRCFGHSIIGYDDGCGYQFGDPQPPRWTPPVC